MWWGEIQPGARPAPPSSVMGETTEGLGRYRRPCASDAARTYAAVAAGVEVGGGGGVVGACGSDRGWRLMPAMDGGGVRRGWKPKDRRNSLLPRGVHDDDEGRGMLMIDRCNDGEILPPWRRIKIADVIVEG